MEEISPFFSANYKHQIPLFEISTMTGRNSASRNGFIVINVLRRQPGAKIKKGHEARVLF